MIPYLNQMLRAGFSKVPVTFQDEITHSNRNIKNKSARSWLATAFCFINWQFYHVRCQAIEISILHVNNNGFAGPLIIETFEKRTLISKHYTRLSRWNTLTLYSLSRTYIPENFRLKALGLNTFETGFRKGLHRVLKRRQHPAIDRRLRWDL